MVSPAPEEPPMETVDDEHPSLPPIEMPVEPNGAPSEPRVPPSEVRARLENRPEAAAVSAEVPESRQAAAHYLETVDNLLASDRLRPKPRALLLLRLCQASQTFRPDRFAVYWPMLQQCGGSLPPDEQPALASLREAVSGQRETKQTPFGREILAAVRQAAETAAHDRSGALAILANCEQRLRKRWWPFGKRPLWQALVQVWAEIDRPAALQRLKKVGGSFQESLLVRENDRQGLSASEWDLALLHGAPLPAMAKTLDADSPSLSISPGAVQKLSGMLLGQVHQARLLDDSQESAADERRQEALNRYLKLVRVLAEPRAAEAEQLMERLVQSTATTSLYAETFVDRFSAIRLQVGTWADITPLQSAGFHYLAQKAPRHVRDLALAQLCAMSVPEDGDASGHWQSLLQHASQPELAEAWFLVTLVRRNMGPEALRLAHASPRSDSLMPRIRRAWVAEHPDTAVDHLRAEDFHGDVIGQFLYARTMADRVAFLRRETEGGNRTLPDAMWQEPDITTLITKTESEKGKLLEGWYTKNEPEATQFREYVRLSGYGHYRHEDLDEYLLMAMIRWDEESPDEVESAMQKMWDTMRPGTMLLRLDLIRNLVFTRCRTVFAARPDLLRSLFIDWMKRTMVDKAIEERLGDTIYRLSLNENAPFLHCLLAAQTLGKYSPTRCDQLLGEAIGHYSASDELIGAAARLYAVDKDFEALQPPRPLKRSAQLEAWQTGVVQSQSRKIIINLLESASSSS